MSKGRGDELIRSCWITEGLEAGCVVQALADKDAAALEKAENEEIGFLALALPSSATS